MPGAETTLVFRREPPMAIFGLTGTTSTSGVSAETVETLKGHEPVRFAIERLALVERFRSVPPPSLLSFSGTLGLGEGVRPLGGRVPGTDLVVARIADRRNRLLRERGLFPDSVGMIRELRDAGP